ncbi:MAG: helix-turn-helix transcriptional regulator [Lentisphaeria bacterium]
MISLDKSIRYKFDFSFDKQIFVDHYSLKRQNHAVFPPDIHYALHFGILLDGCLEIVYTNSHKILHFGNIWFTGPWEAHTSRVISPEVEMLVFTVSPEQLGNIGILNQIEWLLPFVAQNSLRPVINDDDGKMKILTLAKEVITSIDEKDPSNQTFSWLKLHEILLYIINNNINIKEYDKLKVQKNSFKRILPAIMLAKESSDKAITLDDAAKVCFLGKSRFHALFKTATGTTFNKFYTKIRISNASIKLLKTDFSIKEIAEDCGFYDESHFCKIFRKIFHCSPKEFRKQHP